jgi:pyruvate dehydrogenase E1 component alpha subunit
VTFAEILGREDGLCRGRGGSMHLVDAANGVLGATSVVAGNLALAAGAAWAAQAQGKQNISVVFFGDGATGAGAFPTLNIAALWRFRCCSSVRTTATPSSRVAKNIPTSST